MLLGLVGIAFTVLLPTLVLGAAQASATAYAGIMAAMGGGGLIGSLIAALLPVHPVGDRRLILLSLCAGNLGVVILAVASAPLVMG